MNLPFTVLALLVALPALSSAKAIEVQLEHEDDDSYDCYNNTLTLNPSNSRLEKGFMSSPTVTCLRIQGRKVANMDNGVFDQMPNLKYLDLRGNSIRYENLFSFGNLMSVRTLLLGDQDNWSYGSTHIREVYPQLRYLDLSKNELTGISNTYSNPFPQLRYLDVSSNRFYDADFIGLLPQSLTHLLLNGNRMTKFFAANLNQLISLQLDHNQIDSLGSGYYSVQLTNLTSLRDLSVANNRITIINPDTFNDTVQLRRLNISYNGLSSLGRDTMHSLRRLEVLVLDGNLFEDIPATDVMNLTTLSMNCNKIERLTVSPLLNLPYLRKLYLGGNQISEVNAFAFRFQTKLEELYLNDNRLSYLPLGWGDQLNSLNRLDLSGNRFTLVDSLVQSAPTGLTYVYFERNPLEYINTGVIRSTATNITIHIQEQAGRIVSCRQGFHGGVVALDTDDRKGVQQLNATGLEDTEVSLNKTTESEASLALQSALRNNQSIE